MRAWNLVHAQRIGAGAHLSLHPALCTLLEFVIISSNHATEVYNLIKVHLYFQRFDMQSFICYRSLYNWQLLFPDRRCLCNLYLLPYLTLPFSPVIFCAGLCTSWVYFCFAKFKEKPPLPNHRVTNFSHNDALSLYLCFTCHNRLCNLEF